MKTYSTEFSVKYIISGKHTEISKSCIPEIKAIVNIRFFTIFIDEIFLYKPDQFITLDLGTASQRGEAVFLLPGELRIWYS